MITLSFAIKLRRELYDPKDDRSNDYSEEELKLIENLFKNLGGDSRLHSNQTDHDEGQPMFGNYDDYE